jgi:hypothetical protein
MKLVITISLLLFYSCVSAQKTSDGVKNAVSVYNKALVAKDTTALNKLLHASLSYGHSNGWIEDKAEQKANLFNGTIIYHKIEQPELQVTLAGNIATVRGNGAFDVDYKENKHIVFDLHVMQTWVWEKGKWQLLNRQSTSNKK